MDFEKGRKMSKAILVSMVLFLSNIFLIENTHARQTLQPVDHCSSQLPFGIPKSTKSTKIICRTAYVVSYDNTAKIPEWVAFIVLPEHSVGCEPRRPFSQDYSLPITERATTKDYVSTGFDIGHMADAATMSWDRDIETESFILSNTVPQTPSLNRGVWKMLETRTRAWAYSGRSLSIYTGSIYDKESHKIGNGVVVPDKFYKIIVDNTTKQSIAFVFDNEPQVNKNLKDFIVTVLEIEKETGIEFPIPGDKNSKNELWSADTKGLADLKRMVCSVS